MKRSLSRFLIPCILALAIVASARGACDASIYNYEQYQDGRLGVSFMKPAGWKVSVQNGMILLTDPAVNRVAVLLMPLRLERAVSPVELGARVVEVYRKTYPRFGIDESWVNERSRALRANFRYWDEQGRLGLGSFLIIADGRMDALMGFDTTEQSFQAHREAFQSCLQSFSINRYTFFHGTLAQSAGSAAELPPPTITGRFALRSSPDNSAYVYCPESWNIGGGNIAFAAEAPDGTMAVLSYNQSYMGQAPPWEPGAFLVQYLNGIMKMQDVQILRGGRNQELVDEVRRYGYTVDATTFIVQIAAPGGVPFKGYFDIMVAQATPASGFYCVLGATSRADLFERNLSTLVSIARSISPNQQVVMQRQQENFARLQAASRTMSETTDVVIATINSHNRTTDRTFAKINDYYGNRETMISTADNDVRRFDAGVPRSVEDPRYPGYEYRPLTNDEWDRYLNGTLP